MMEGVSVKYLAELVGKTERRIRQIDKELPEIEKLLEADDNGKYDPAFFVKRWVAYQIKQEGGQEESLDNIKAQHEKVKMEKSKIELGILQGEICKTEEMLQLWCMILKSLSNGMLSIPHTLAPRLSNMESAREIEAMIETEIKAAMMELARTPLPEDVKDNGYAKDMAAGNVHAGAAREDEGE